MLLGCPPDICRCSSADCGRAGCWLAGRLATPDECWFLDLDGDLFEVAFRPAVIDALEPAVRERLCSVEDTERPSCEGMVASGAFRSSEKSSSSFSIKWFLPLASSVDRGYKESN